MVLKSHSSNFISFRSYYSRLFSLEINTMRLTFLILTIAGLSMAAAPVWTSTKILIDNISDKEKRSPLEEPARKMVAWAIANQDFVWYVLNSQLLN